MNKGTVFTIYADPTHLKTFGEKRISHIFFNGKRIKVEPDWKSVELTLSMKEWPAESVKLEEVGMQKPDKVSFSKFKVTKDDCKS